jgi:hypothetical protein
LFDDFDDVIDDFFLYLREGRDENNQYTYQSLRCIEKKESLEPWLLNTFRNYLSVRAAKEGQITYSELCTENVTDTDVPSTLTDEQMLSMASNLIAYAHQEFIPRDCFIFLRTMLTMLDKQKAMSNEAIAKVLEMTGVSYRVTVYRIKCRLANYCSRLLQGENFHLDEAHQQMSQQINDGFTHLYPTLYGYYNQTIDALTNADAIKLLHQEYFVTTGNIMHEPEPSYSTTLSIQVFWNKLNRFLIV